MFEILIVDDRKEFRTLFKSLIKASDFNADVSEAEGLEGTLAILAQKKIDGVILDYILDGSSGLDVLRQVKSIQPDLSVLMVSSYDKDSIERETLTAGADAFLSKDKLSPEILTQILVKILSKNNSDMNASAFKGLAGMKVLLVDDTSQNLDVLRKTLDQKGLDISIAPNGEIALELVSMDPPDLILLDIMMPVLDGFETCRKLKENDVWKNIPVIFITALTREEDFIKGFILGAVDYITKPFRSEEVLARVSNHLRTRKLLNEKVMLLNQAAKKDKDHAAELQRSNEELKSFASIASHDLQEPLRKIVVLGDRLSTRIPETDAQGRDYLNRMQNSALRMRNLIEDILQYSQIENKSRSFESLDLNKVIESVLNDLEVRISETQGTVNSSDLPVIDGDPVQLHQLFLNLIGNALKFQREGAPPIVNLDSVKMENGFWEISVEDNGIGIEEEHVDKVFKPFERIHGRTTYEGTGIGLTICNKIVSQHGGKITVKRKSANGVIFHIILPENQNL